MLKVTRSVSQHYHIFNSIGNIFAGIESTISTSSMLESSGMCKENVVLSTVSINLIGKDIIGQLMSAPIINKLSKTSDCAPMKNMKINIALFEFSTLLECLTPFFPVSYFLLLASVGNIGKNVSFVGIGAFNYSIINKLSTSENNIAELYSKVTIISSLSYSVGMIIGLGIIKYIPCYYTRLGLLPFLGISRYMCIKKSVEGLI